ncbi:MAG: phenylacetate--CoA ligase [bacterium]|nr:phenylacetate--CoA ligase [bacterium]
MKANIAQGFWDEKIECMDRKSMEALQTERLRDLVKRVYATVPFHQRRFAEHGVRPEDIKSLKDLARLPFMTKQDLRDTYPFGLFSRPMDEVVEIHSSSGTTGKPVVVGYTRNDLDLWATVMARTLRCGGVSEKDVVQNAYGYGLFTGGLGVHYGAQKIGASVVPISGGNSKRQIMIMQDFGTDALCCTPSYSLCLAEVAEEMGVDLRTMKLRVGFFGAEPWSESMRAEIEKKLGILALDIYGLTEIIGPGVASECPYRKGLHINEDHFLPEVIDSETGQVLPYGQEGELVITTLTKEAFPVIRFRTRDITVLDPEPCECGRTLVRMKRVTGRTDDMLIIRGVNVFPSQIEDVLVKIEGVAPHYLIVVDRKGTLDDIEIRVEVSEGNLADEVKKFEELERKIKNELESVLGISTKIKLVEPHAIERSMGKAVRVQDRRNLKED